MIPQVNGIPNYQMHANWIEYVKTFIGYKIDYDYINMGFDEDECKNNDNSDSDCDDYEDRDYKRMEKLDLVWKNYLNENNLLESLNMCKSISFHNATSGRCSTYDKESLCGAIIFGYELKFDDIEVIKSPEDKITPDKVRIDFEFPKNCLNVLTEFILTIRETSNSDHTDRFRSKVKAELKFGFYGSLL